MKKEPFALVALNDLEIFSLASSMITIYCGLFFIYDVPEGSKDYVNGSKNNKLISIVKLPEWVKILFFFFIVLSNMMFFLYWIYKMYIELKSLIIKKLGKIYLFLCLCMNKSKFDYEKKTIEIQEENELMREEYIKCKF